jgi:hypothetical protein
MSVAVLERNTHRGRGVTDAGELRPTRDGRGGLQMPLLREAALANVGNDAVRQASLDAPCTLDALMMRTWHGLLLGGHVECPACGGQMSSCVTGDPAAPEGWCGDCGCVLS